MYRKFQFNSANSVEGQVMAAAKILSNKLWPKIVIVKTTRRRTHRLPHQDRTPLFIQSPLLLQIRKGSKRGRTIKMMVTTAAMMMTETPKDGGSFCRLLFPLMIGTSLHVPTARTTLLNIVVVISSGDHVR